MRSVRETLENIWEALNPSEPGPRYLIAFFSAAITLFLIGYLIGHL